MVAPNGYAERFTALMGERKLTVRDVAEQVGVSYQAVKKIKDGKSHMMAADNNARAAAVFDVDADWLATGKGSRARKRAECSTDAAEIAAIFDATTELGRTVLRATAHALVVEPRPAPPSVEPGAPHAAPRTELPSASQKRGA